MKQCLKYWCSPSYPGYPSNALPELIEDLHLYDQCVVINDASYTMSEYSYYPKEGVG